MVAKEQQIPCLIVVVSNRAETLKLSRHPSSISVILSFTQSTILNIICFDNGGTALSRMFIYGVLNIRNINKTLIFKFKNKNLPLTKILLIHLNLSRGENIMGIDMLAYCMFVINVTPENETMITIELDKYSFHDIQIFSSILNGNFTVHFISSDVHIP